jgi:hypothetical protein
MRGDIKLFTLRMDMERSRQLRATGRADGTGSFLHEMAPTSYESPFLKGFKELISGR